MHNILKRTTNPAAADYIFQQASELRADIDEDKPRRTLDERAVFDPESPVDFARIQAEAIMQVAYREAEELKEAALAQAEQKSEEMLRQARDEGYSRGFAEGMAGAMTEAKRQREQLAVEQTKEIKDFLESAAIEREHLLKETHDELKNLSLAIAEKVIRVSLKSSGDIILRMIESATEKHRRCEWVHVYIADCDAKTMTFTAPQLASSLSHVSDRVRLIPMADEESGTCIIEMPDEIIDASVSTQLENIKTVLANSEPDGFGG